MAVGSVPFAGAVKLLVVLTYTTLLLPLPLVQLAVSAEAVIPGRGKLILLACVVGVVQHIVNVLWLFGLLVAVLLKYNAELPEQLAS